MQYAKEKQRLAHWLFNWLIASLCVGQHELLSELIYLKKKGILYVVNNIQHCGEIGHHQLSMFADISIRRNMVHNHWVHFLGCVLQNGAMCVTNFGSKINIKNMVLKKMVKK